MPFIRFALAVLMVLTINKQSMLAQALPKGSVNFSFGYGYNAFTSTITKTWASEPGFKSTALGPAHFKFEYMVGRRYGIGISANYLSYALSYDDSYFDPNQILKIGKATISYATISALIRNNFYYVNSKRFALYSGFGIGYRTGSWTFKSEDPNYPKQTTPNFIPIGFEVTTGMKVLFTPNIGAYLELGLAKSFVQAGLCISLGGRGGADGGGTGAEGGERYRIWQFED